MMGWFLNGLEKYGTLVRHTEPQNHPVMRQLFRHKVGIEVAIVSYFIGFIVSSTVIYSNRVLELA